MNKISFLWNHIMTEYSKWLRLGSIPFWQKDVSTLTFFVVKNLSLSSTLTRNRDAIKSYFFFLMGKIFLYVYTEALLDILIFIYEIKKNLIIVCEAQYFQLNILSFNFTDLFILCTISFNNFEKCNLIRFYLMINKNLVIDECFSTLLPMALFEDIKIDIDEFIILIWPNLSNIILGRKKNSY